eukprot:14633029-Alexandrium_andersonii.AAC.1
METDCGRSLRGRRNFGGPPRCPEGHAAASPCASSPGCRSSRALGGGAPWAPCLLYTSDAADDM